MSEINSKNNQNTNKSFYIELPADISAKPNTLCNLIASDNSNITLVFCEYSELQFVENVISKRGIIAKRLNGYLDLKQIPALQDYIKQNKIQAIVLTQNSCKNLEELKVDLMINYSLADITAETYQQRLNLLSETGRSVTLVGLRDLTSFLPLSKSLSENTEHPVRMEKLSAPSESLPAAAGKIATLLKGINTESLQVSPGDLNLAEDFLKYYQDNVSEREVITKLIAHFIKQLPNNAATATSNNRSINDELNSDKKQEFVNEEEDSDENEERERPLRTTPAKEAQINSVTFKVSQGLNNEMNFETFCSLAEEFAGADAHAISELSVSSDSMSLETTVDNFRIIFDNLNGIEHNGAELVLEALSELPRNFKRNTPRPNNEGGSSHVYLTGKDRGNGGERPSRGGYRNNNDRGRGGYGRNERSNNGGGGGYRGRSDDRRGGGDDRNGGGYERRGGSDRDGGGYRGRSDDRRDGGRSSGGGGYGQRRGGGYGGGGGGGRSPRSRFDNR